MDRNQFPRRICRLALCLLATEIGVWWSQQSSLMPPPDILADKPRLHSPPALDSTVPSQPAENSANGPPSFAID